MGELPWKTRGTRLYPLTIFSSHSGAAVAKRDYGIPARRAWRNDSISGGFDRQQFFQNSNDERREVSNRKRPLKALEGSRIFQ
jgi:hypothetical protein